MGAVNMNDQRNDGAYLLYDPANTVQGTDSNNSLVGNKINILTFENMDAGTVVTVYIRVHALSVWIPHTVVDNSNAEGFVDFGHNPPNFCKVERSGGSQDIIVYAQKAIND